MQLIREKYIAPEVLPVDIRPEGVILVDSPLGDTESIDDPSDWGGQGGWS